MEQNICRLCLEEGADISVFQDDQKVLKDFKYFCQLSISVNDGLPDQICEVCLDTMHYVVSFLNKCKITDDILRNKCKRINPDRNRSHFLEKTVKQETVFIQDFESSVFDEYIRPKIEDPEPFKSDSDDSTWELALNEICCEKSYCKNKGSLNSADENCNNEHSNNEHSNLYLHDKDNSDRLEVNSLVTERNRDIEELYSSDGSSATKSKRVGKKKIAKNFSYASKKKVLLAKPLSCSQLCPVCGASFENPQKLNRHVILHNTKCIHTCGVCLKSFKNKGALKEHSEIHGERESLTCHVCGKIMKSKSLLRKHVVYVHERRLASKCNICNNVYQTTTGLKRHMKQHMGIKNFECDICGYKSTFKATLIRHMLTHSDVRPFSCRYCEKCFKDKKSLEQHEMLHTGETPYVCVVCGRGYNQGCNLKSHFLNNHKGVKYPGAAAQRVNQKSTSNFETFVFGYDKTL